MDDNEKRASATSSRAAPRVGWQSLTTSSPASTTTCRSSSIPSKIPPTGSTPAGPSALYIVDERGVIVYKGQRPAPSASTRRGRGLAGGAPTDERRIGPSGAALAAWQPRKSGEPVLGAGERGSEGRRGGGERGGPKTRARRRAGPDGDGGQAAGQRAAAGPGRAGPSQPGRTRGVAAAASQPGSRWRRLPPRSRLFASTARSGEAVVAPVVPVVASVAAGLPAVVPLLSGVLVGSLLPRALGWLGLPPGHRPPGCPR